MKIHLTLTLFLLLIFCTMSYSQDDSQKTEFSFQQSFNTYSRKKPAYVTLKDGTKLKGLIKGLKRKKGQIGQLKIKQENDVKVISASEIKDLYMAPSGFDKLNKLDDNLFNVNKWKGSRLDTVLKKGYTLYTNQMVSLKNKKKEKEYLMQLVNPSFDKVIEVYADPWAKETLSLGIGALEVAGGIEKSYYIKKDSKMIWLRKSDFKKSYKNLFFDNQKFKEEYKDQKLVWRNLANYIAEYNDFCSE